MATLTSDIWIATADGLDAWRVTDVPDDANHGVLIPEFSPNGRLLEWSERTRAPALWNPVQVAGFWVIQVAHFVVAANGTPTVTGAQTIDPGGNAFNETGGFSPDSTTIAFTSDFETHNFWTNQIYTINLATGRIVQLTRGRDYNEHPRYTPDGRVVWMAGNRQPGNHSGTDWWVMNANGSDQQRLTDLNDRSSPQYFGQTVYATVVQTSNWSADGHSFVADLELSLLTSNSDIVRVQLTCR